MRVIINSSVIADGIVDLQADCYKNGVLLCTESLLKATLLEQQLVSHHISYNMDNILLMCIMVIQLAIITRLEPNSNRSTGCNRCTTFDSSLCL